MRAIDNGDLEDYVVPITYRPFDKKWIFYEDAVVWRTVKKIMRHMLEPNLALVTCRQQADAGFQHALVTDTIVESSYVSNKTREIGYTFPLYLYTDTQTEDKKESSGVTLTMFFDQPKGGYKVKRSNIDLSLFSDLNNIFAKEPAPEEIFYYVYAILYSEVYRQKYREFLKIDFPRIPFHKLGKLGEQLVDLHLLKSSELKRSVVKFQGKNSNIVEKRERKKRRIYINDKQYFEGVKPKIWEYKIGGYQVLDKWLKDRKGRVLSSEDIKHYCRTVTALAKTIEIQKQIDELYPQVEKKFLS